MIKTKKKDDQDIEKNNVEDQRDDELEKKKEEFDRRRALEEQTARVFFIEEILPDLKNAYEKVMSVINSSENSENEENKEDEGELECDKDVKEKITEDEMRKAHVYFLYLSGVRRKMQIRHELNLHAKNIKKNFEIICTSSENDDLENNVSAKEKEDEIEDPKRKYSSDNLLVIGRKNKKDEKHELIKKLKQETLKKLENGIKFYDEFNKIIRQLRTGNRDPLAAARDGDPNFITYSLSSNKMLIILNRAKKFLEEDVNDEILFSLINGKIPEDIHRILTERRFLGDNQEDSKVTCFEALISTFMLTVKEHSVRCSTGKSESYNLFDVAVRKGEGENVGIREATDYEFKPPSDKPWLLNSAMVYHISLSNYKFKEDDLNEIYWSKKERKETHKVMHELKTRKEKYLEQQKLKKEREHTTSEPKKQSEEEITWTEGDERKLEENKRKLEENERKLEEQRKIFEEQFEGRSLTDIFLRISSEVSKNKFTYGVPVKISFANECCDSDERANICLGIDLTKGSSEQEKIFGLLGIYNIGYAWGDVSVDKPTNERAYKLNRFAFRDCSGLIVENANTPFRIWSRIFYPNKVFEVPESLKENFEAIPFEEMKCMDLFSKKGGGHLGFCASQTEDYVYTYEATRAMERGIEGLGIRLYYKRKLNEDEKDVCNSERYEDEYEFVRRKYGFEENYDVARTKTLRNFEKERLPFLAAYSTFEKKSEGKCYYVEGGEETNVSKEDEEETFSNDELIITKNRYGVCKV